MMLKAIGISNKTLKGITYSQPAFMGIYQCQRLLQWFL